MRINNNLKKAEYDRLYRLRNLKKRRAQQKAWYRISENKKAKQAYDKKYKRKNRIKINKKYVLKRKSNIQEKLKYNLRNRLYTALKKSYKSGSAVKDCGCSMEYLKIHLEKQFKTGMTWNNWSRTGWHIDHKIPLKAFDLTDRNQFLIAVNYKNLQPLWSWENCSKSGKIF